MGVFSIRSGFVLKSRGEPHRRLEGSLMEVLCLIYHSSLVVKISSRGLRGHEKLGTR